MRAAAALREDGDSAVAPVVAERSGERTCFAQPVTARSRTRARIARRGLIVNQRSTTPPRTKRPACDAGPRARILRAHVALRIGIDIGGTFTDLVPLDEATGALW